MYPSSRDYKIEQKYTLSLLNFWFYFATVTDITWKEECSVNFAFYVCK